MIRRTFDDLYDTMPWDQIDNVVFDVGNVLLKFDPDDIVSTYAPEVTGKLREKLLERVFNSSYWGMLDYGIASFDEITEAMIGDDPELEAPVRAIMAGWPEMKGVLPEGVAVLKKCSAMGKKLVVLSNYHDRSFSVVDEKYDFFRLFDHKVISSRVLMMKPDPDIYHHAELACGLEPARTLFIDDSPINITVALACGWQGICYRKPGMLARFFGVEV